MPLTAKQVQNAKPGSLSDGQGLILKVSPSGSKSWLLRVQLDGKRRDYGLGSAKELTLAEAREKAGQWRKLAKDGINPAVEAKRKRLGIPTFEEAAKEFHQIAAQAWKKGKHNNQPELAQQQLLELERAASLVAATTTTPCDSFNSCCYCCC